VLLLDEAEERVDVQSRFEDFFKEEQYRKVIGMLPIEGKTSFGVDFGDLVAFDNELAKGLIDDPDEFLKHAKHAAMNQLQIEDIAYASKVKELNIRIYHLFDVTPLRSVGSEHIGKLIMINGVVVKSTVVKPKVLKAAFECRRCGTINYVEQTTPFLRIPLRCENPSCRAKGPFELVQSESEFINVQDIWIQESPEELPPGQLPRTLRVKITGDIVDTARPGDNVSIVGVPRVFPRKAGKTGKSSVFDLFLEANSIEVLGKEPEAIPTLEEVNRIRELSKDPWIHKKIISSIAPSIYGYETIKEAIMYLLFGGVPKERPDIKIRGEINVLLIGDPGTAKSQLLRYVSRIAPRGLYTSGRGSSGVGLTAAVLRDKNTGEMTLEAGALVLADKGVACIDELDKMRAEDRSAIHEALEQHTVSVAKGGIVATLNARTAVLAAANPVLGRYDSYRTIIENVSFPVTLLSRFDLIFLMRDIPERDRDKSVSRHILKIHKGGFAESPIPPELLRKYITYARTIKPVLTNEAIERLEQFYMKMREVSAKSEGAPITISPRQLEALVRIAEARALAALRTKVLAEDAEAAIRIMMKSLEEVGVDVASGKQDIDILLTGKPKSLRDKVGSVLATLVELQRETGMVEKTVLIDELKEKYGINAMESNRIIEELLKEGVIYSPREGYLKKT